MSYHSSKEKATIKNVSRFKLLQVKAATERNKYILSSYQGLQEAHLTKEDLAFEPAKDF